MKRASMIFACLFSTWAAVHSAGCTQPAAAQSGSYTRSCRNCHSDDVTLSCECRREDGSWGSTSIRYDWCNADIANCNGNLVCGGC